MPNKKTSLRPPANRKGTELILKANPGLHLKDDNSGIEIGAGIFLIGNRQGFRWLADYFTWRADRIDEKGPFYKGFPDDPDPLDTHGPFNRSLSEPICFTVGSFSKKHRARILRACGISRKSRLPGDLAMMYRSTLEWLQRLAEDDRYQGAPAWAPIIAILEQLIRETRETIPRLKKAAKKPKTRAANVRPVIPG